MKKAFKTLNNVLERKLTLMKTKWMFKFKFKIEDISRRKRQTFFLR